MTINNKVSIKDALKRYSELRHDFEMWGINGDNGEQLEQLVWDLLGLPGKPTDEDALKVLNGVLNMFNLPEHTDIRDEKED